MDDPEKLDENSQASQTITPPSISLPKGGGAIRGIGEKFAANPVPGTGNMSVPIATSSRPSGFGPQLSLSHYSGAGYGPFGFGWNISLSSIIRKADKGHSRYQDAIDSDEFILASAEDLDPVLKQENSDWIPENIPDRVIGATCSCSNINKQTVWLLRVFVFLLQVQTISYGICGREGYVVAKVLERAQ